MQGIYQTLALLSGKPAQFRGEDVLDLEWAVPLREELLSGISECPSSPG